MSNPENNKDYDLNYFSSGKDKDLVDNNNLMPGDDFNDEVEFDINAFTKQSDEVNSETFDLTDETDLNNDVSLESFKDTRSFIKRFTEKKLTKESKLKIKHYSKIIGKALLSLMLIGVITGCLVVGAFAIYVFNYVDDKVYEDLDEMSLGFTTTIYAPDTKTGEFVEYKRLHGEENRIWVEFDKMPEDLKNAFVAIEDKRFRQHQGVDWKRTVAAFANMFVDLYSSNQGGSTITQQLVKNITGDNKQTPMRKIREIMRARYLEGEYHKDTILECYLNT
ncbi:MAG: transglycosylase domain-containing protein, partial [Clostridia bacterium]|nr:transglycosylase domain-containing protein [Clostridia bacterium]